MNKDWPYTKAVDPDIYNIHKHWPKISIVTPSYNQGEFIEETILSIINQKYPNLEYIIIDGGSTDNTIDIIKKYESSLTYWVSEKDKGQSHAINKGFAKATGEILAYLNSDDCYFPNTLFEIANSYLNEDKPIDILMVGDCYWAKGFEDKNGYLDIPLFPDTLKQALIKRGLGSQPSMFWTMKNHNLKFYENLNFCMDFEFWLQLIVHDYKIIRINKSLSLFRTHTDSKTTKLQIVLEQEVLGVISIYLKKLNYNDAIEVRQLTQKLEILNLGKALVDANRTKLQIFIALFSLKTTIMKIKFFIRLFYKK